MYKSTPTDYSLVTPESGRIFEGGQPQKPDVTVFKSMEKTEDGKETVHQRKFRVIQ
jgi:hypothetical protein